MDNTEILAHEFLHSLVTLLPHTDINLMSVDEGVLTYSIRKGLVALGIKFSQSVIEDSQANSAAIAAKRIRDMVQDEVGDLSPDDRLVHNYLTGELSDEIRVVYADNSEHGVAANRGIVDSIEIALTKITTGLYVGASAAHGVVVVRRE